jgi:hypothetical protein
VGYLATARHALYGLGMQAAEKFSCLFIIQEWLELRLFLHLQHRSIRFTSSSTESRAPYTPSPAKNVHASMPDSAERPVPSSISISLTPNQQNRKT